jgi:hypothetical protein
LRSIREEEPHASEREGGFSDHERWSEEAEIKRANPQSGSDPASREPQSGRARPRRTVAVVVSAESSPESLHDEDALEHRTEHAVCSIKPPQLVLRLINPSPFYHICPSISIPQPPVYSS